MNFVKPKNNYFDSNFLFKNSLESAKFSAKDFYFKVLVKWDPIVPSLGEKVEISNIGWKHLHHKTRSKFDNMARYFVLPKIIAVFQDENIKPIYETGRDPETPTEFWSFLAEVDGVLVKIVVRSVNKGHKHLFSVMWRGEVQKGTKNEAVSRIYKRTRGVITPQLQQLLNNFNAKMSRGTSL